MLEKDLRQDNEFDPYQFCIKLWKNKLLIGIFTILSTLVIMFYKFSIDTIPKYEGMALVEIGGVYVQSTGYQQLDNANNLLVILRTKFNDGNVQITTPPGSSNLILISSIGTNKEDIMQNLKTIMNYILERHKYKIKFYKNQQYEMTKLVADMKVGDSPINTKNKSLIIIISFITGFIVSVFLLLFIEFIRKFNNAK